MRVEFPDLKRCCFCLPLRYGLIGWTYFKLILLCLLIFIMIQNILWLINESQHTQEQAVDLAISIILFFIQIGDLIFSIIVLVGSHLKNVKLLRWYYYYTTVALAISVLMYTIQVIIMLSTNWFLLYNHYVYPFIMAYFSLLFIIIVIYIYTILLTRSEIRKLENDCEVKFVNHAAEAECMSICQDLGHDDKTASDDVTV